jgi:diguanylate cyclase (GGDEF)-like protein
MPAAMNGGRMPGGRASGAALLALLYAVSGVLCLLGALSPMATRTPVPLLSGLALVGALGAAVRWLRRDRLGTGTVHAALALVSLLVGLLAWRSATAVGILGLGPAMVALAVYCGHFLSPAAARAQVALLLGVASAGAAAAGPAGFANAWLTTVVTVAALTEVQARLSGELHRAAGTDPLTGLANRRAWEAETQRGLAHARRSGEPLTIAIIDLDGFKAINDEDGHGAGDALLQSLAREWSAELRLSDLLGRYGGDEFVLCLPNTDAQRAAELLGRLRVSHPASWSAGTASACPGDTLTDLLLRADAELYQQKRRSRRTV